MRHVVHGAWIAACLALAGVFAWTEWHAEPDSARGESRARDIARPGIGDVLPDVSARIGCEDWLDCEPWLAEEGGEVLSPARERGLERAYESALLELLEAGRLGRPNYDLLELLAEVRESELGREAKLRVFALLLERGEGLAEAADPEVAETAQDWVVSALHAIAAVDVERGAGIAAELIARHREDAGFQGDILGSVDHFFLVSRTALAVPDDLLYLRRELLERAQQGVRERTGDVDEYESEELAFHAIDLGRFLHGSQRAVMAEIVDTLEAFARRGVAAPLDFFDRAVSRLGPFDPREQAVLKDALLERFPAVAEDDVDVRLAALARRQARRAVAPVRAEPAGEADFVPVRRSEIPRASRVDAVQLQDEWRPVGQLTGDGQWH
jgi:hypothetical protein